MPLGSSSRTGMAGAGADARMAGGFLEVPSPPLQVDWKNANAGAKGPSARQTNHSPCD